MSVNAAFSQKAFADFAKINYPLLSDSSGKTMTALVCSIQKDGKPSARTLSSIRKGWYVI